MEVVDFLRWVVEQGHTSIFAWVAIWLGSGIGFLEIPDYLRCRRYAYSAVYLVLIFIMTFSFGNIINIMHNQNNWITMMNNQTYQDLFFSSRSWFGNLLVDKRTSWYESPISSFAVVAHFTVLMFAGIFFDLFNGLRSRIIRFVMDC